MKKRVRRVQTRSFIGTTNSKQTPEQKRISELERNLKDAELEPDILKKQIGTNHYTFLLTHFMGYCLSQQKWDSN